jgi:5-methyltetrahydrofolate--homocysteine methyltransferase
MEIGRKLKNAVINGEEEKALDLTKEALEQGLEAEVILNDSLISAMDVVGKRFQAGEIYVPEMLIAAEAMKSSVKVLEPLLIDSGVKSLGIVVIGTVKGDLHDIGKNLVAMMLEGNGFEVIDAGSDTSPEKFIQLTKDNKAEIVGLSALLTTTMFEMKNTMDAFKEVDGMENVRFMVGGAPVTKEFAEKIGADGYAADAGSAVDLAKELLEKKN